MRSDPGPSSSKHFDFGLVCGGLHLRKHDGSTIVLSTSLAMEGAMKPKQSPTPPTRVGGDFAVPRKHSNKITGEINYRFAGDFPGESAGRIKLEEIAAKRVFNDSIESLADYTGPHRLRQMRITCAMKPTMAFVKEMIELGWDAQRICDHRRAYAQCAAEWAGLKRESMQDIIDELEASPEWVECDDLLALTKTGRSGALPESHTRAQKADGEPKDPPASQASTVVPFAAPMSEPRPCIISARGPDPLNPEFSTRENRKRAVEKWKTGWSTPERRCTSEDLTEAAYNSKDRAFLNRWENGKVGLVKPEASDRVRAIEALLRNNTPPKWRTAARRPQ